jgi:hypothetical protein
MLRTKRTARAAYAATVLLFGAAGALAAQSTPYVTNLDPAYADLDVLVSQGLVRRIVLGERPYSRAAFARFVAEATERVALRDGGLDARSREALDRLSTRFGPGAEEEARVVRPRSLRVDAAGADSPYRPTRPGGEGYIDSAINPLLQLQQGRVLEDGFTAGMEAGFDLSAGPVAGQARPRAWLGAPREPDGVDAHVTLLEAYARTVWGPASLELGRNHVTAGQGTVGGTTLSHNARGLDMVRLSMDRPAQLPGPLRGLGLWQLSGLLSYLGENRDVPGSYMTVLRLSSRPSRFTELGINYMNVQGGEGSPAGNWRDRLFDTFLFWRNGGYLEISDKLAGFDFALTVPALHSNLHVNFLTTDDRGRFKQPASGIWEDAIWVAGGRLFRIGPSGRFDVWGEWRHAGAIIYSHHQFTSGIAIDGLAIGDPIGPNTASVQGGIDWTGSTSRVGVAAAWELYSGDDYGFGLPPGAVYPDYDWWRVANNPDETRWRFTTEWTGPAPLEDLEATARLGYEHVTRFNYTDENRSNFFVQLVAGYRW